MSSRKVAGGNGFCRFMEPEKRRHTGKYTGGRGVLRADRGERGCYIHTIHGTLTQKYATPNNFVTVAGAVMMAMVPS